MTIAATQYTSFYAKSQTDIGSPATCDVSNAVCLMNVAIKTAGTQMITRDDVSCGYGGAVPPVLSDRYFDISFTLELTVPDTKGDIDTWTYAPIFKAMPSVITESALTSVAIQRALGQGVNTDWVPMTFEAHTYNGVRRRATDVMVAIQSVSAMAGERMLVEFVGIGKWTADAASSLVAPAPVNAQLPIVCINGMLNDGVLEAADFGWKLSTGLSLMPIASASETYGWAAPIMVADGPCTLAYAVLADTDYQVALTANDPLTITASFGTASIDIETAYLTKADASETDGAQTYDLEVACIYNSTAADWVLTLA